MTATEFKLRHGTWSMGDGPESKLTILRQNVGKWVYVRMDQVDSISPSRLLIGARFRGILQEERTGRFSVSISSVGSDGALIEFHPDSVRRIEVTEITLGV